MIDTFATTVYQMLSSEKYIWLDIMYFSFPKVLEEGCVNKLVVGEGVDISQNLEIFLGGVNYVKRVVIILE